MKRSVPFFARVATVVVAGSISLLGLAPASGASTPTATVNVVGYSVLKAAYAAVETAFQATPAGTGVAFTNSFGASDTQTQNVANGQAADVVNLSYVPNIQTLVTAGKVPASWTRQEYVFGHVDATLTGTKAQTTFPTPGIVTNSVVTFLVRQGNPLKIKDWSDLVKPGVQIVTPNPLTSGSAHWNITAAYASQLQIGKNGTQARSFLKQFLSHTVAQPSSGSASLAAFVAGTGNVLVTYEDDARAAVNAGDQVQIVTPTHTFLIQNPVALTLNGLSKPAAVNFYRFLFSAAGQGIFASLGFRSVLNSIWSATKSQFPARNTASTLWNVTNINKQGWNFVNPFLFSPNVTFVKGSHTDPLVGVATYFEQFAGSGS